MNLVCTTRDPNYHMSKRPAPVHAHTWLLTEAESASARLRVGACVEDSDSIERTLIDALLAEDYLAEDMFALVRNNPEVASKLTELTHHAHLDVRRRELRSDPVKLASFDALLEHRHMFLMSALARQRDQRISPFYTAGLSVIVVR